MTLFKQPWFLILLFVVAVYSYQLYQSPKIVKISSSTATAVEKTNTETTLEDAKNPISVKISKEFEAENLKNFELSTELNMKVKFNPTDGDKMIISLIGEGADYKNKGEQLSDWFQISRKAYTLKLKSFDKKSFRGFESMKNLAKKIQGKRTDSDFTMIIEYPEKFRFSRINLETISSDVFAAGLTFNTFHMTSVSGDLRLQSGEGSKMKIESVSGHSHLEISGLEKFEFSSVSGDAFIQSSSNPELQFESISGDLNLQIPKESSIDVSFESMTGELINDFSNNESKGKRLKFSSLSGSAKISKH